ncbi:STAS domain-containing protein [Streptomyces sp. CLCI03]
MSILPPRPLEMTSVRTNDTVRIELFGDLDHTTTHRLLDTVTRVLIDHPGLGELRLGCAGITAIDSIGLSTLLMIRRQSDAAGARLYLEDRPLRLERLLDLTGTLDYLTSTSGGPAVVSEGSGQAAPETAVNTPDARTDGRVARETRPPL